MDTPAPDRPDELPDFVSRRQLLGLAGSVGAAAVVGACSNNTRMDAVAASATGPGPPSPPNPVATSATGVSLTTSPPLEPGTSPALAPSTNSALLLCRDAWGARPARSGGRPHTI